MKLHTRRRLFFGMAALLALAVVSTACGSRGTNSSTAKEPKRNAGIPAATAASSPSVSPSVSPTAGTKTWSSPPAMSIDTNKSYTAKFDTNKGSFTVELYAKDAPKTVNNFVFLANQHYFEGIVFHRIIESFMIQSGDPKGNGTGGPGYQFEDELPSPHKYEPGIVAMANAGPDTNGSQFFICTGDDSQNLNQMPNYTIFGKVKDGMDTVLAIAKTPVQMGPSGENSSPKEKVIINSVSIVEQ